jgi:hypothetical protein
MMAQCFSCSGGTGMDSIKKLTGPHYAEHVFLHPIFFAGLILHTGASGVQNIDALFLMLGWA